MTALSALAGLGGALERHPTRDCACRVFRSREHAETYITQQEDQ